MPGGLDTAKCERNVRAHPANIYLDALQNLIHNRQRVLLECHKLLDYVKSQESCVRSCLSRLDIIREALEFEREAYPVRLVAGSGVATLLA